MFGPRGDEGCRRVEVHRGVGVQGGSWVHLVDEGKFHSQGVCDRGCSLCSSCIGRNDNGFLVVGDVVLDITLQQWASVQVVDGNVKESLILRIVEIHSDDVVGAGAGEETGHKGTGLGDPLTVTEAGLVGVIVGVAVSTREGWGTGCSTVFGVREAQWSWDLGGSSIAAWVVGIAALGDSVELSFKTVGQLGGGELCGVVSSGGGGSTLESIWLVSNGWGFRQGGANLVVWNVWLTRIWEERHDCCHLLCRCSLAGRDGDEEFHDVVVDLATS